MSCSVNDISRMIVISVYCSSLAPMTQILHVRNVGNTKGCANSNYMYLGASSRAMPSSACNIAGVG